MSTNFRTTAVSTLGALALSATCIFAAVGPARAATPGTAADWAQTVQNRVSTANDDASTRFASGQVAEALLTVRFAADGSLRGVALEKSTGNAGLDAHAIKVAQRVDYPAMPASMQGRDQSVTMRLVFGDSSHQVDQYLARRTVDDGLRFAASGRSADKGSAE